MMSNMSYCRFRNTLPDLLDCAEALDDFDGLSDEERRSATRMIRLAKKIADDFGDLVDTE